MAADEQPTIPVSQGAQFAGQPASHSVGLAAMRADWIAFYDAEYHLVVRFVMRSAVTTYGGLHGTGISGPWGVQEEQAVNGAHVIANAPLLYNSGTTFNVRVNG